MVKRVACFLTCGYTETGAMQYFLKKINGNYEFKQYLPNRTIKKKGDSKAISPSISGLTGEALLEKIYDIVEKHSQELAECAAILVEDDLDDRFSTLSELEIENYLCSLKTKICCKLGKNIPVFVLYAAPEVESWFIADWANGFEFLYCSSGVVDDVEYGARKFFTHNLKKYLETHILREYCTDIESYGCFGESYVKLSDQLITAIQTDSKAWLEGQRGVNKKYVEEILQSRCLYYSKKTHGNLMLKNIMPEIVAQCCHTYFRKTYTELKVF